MNLGQWGVFSFTDVLDKAGLAELASRVEGMGYSSLWYPEAFNYETFAVGGYLLQNSEKLIVGSGIANIYARDPAASVMGHNSLNALYDNRFVLGLGVSHAPLVSDLRGHEYTKPVTTMRAYLDAMDQSWEALGGAPAEKQVVLAALGPNMSKLSSDRTLGAYPYNITPQQAKLSSDYMGGKGLVICEQKVVLSSDPDEARAAARGALDPYMSLPNYYNNWFRLGFDQSDLENGGSDRLMDAMVLWGSADEIKGKLNQYIEQGAHCVTIQPIKKDGQPGPCWDALEALAPA
ncbi:MAG: TIGR03620 family F420-dependent LLM class oxidoreductase [Pseudomonadota bacterium]